VVGSIYGGDGEGVAVGVLVAVGGGDAVCAPPVACAGQVSASSRYWTWVWPASVITVAEACVNCAPGRVAT
jgi:hypothetical protein